MTDKAIYSVITGTGSYIPSKCVKNKDFLDHEFHDTHGKMLDKSNQEIVDKFLEITTIAERRYVTDNLVASDIGTLAAREALAASGVNPEELDYVIFAHNFGDVKKGANRVDIVPALAARVKHQLGIENPDAVAYDIIFGCPGWLQGLIQADYYIRSGDARKVLVIGAEVLSRIYDPHDRDGMLYADGAGAVVVEGRTSDTPVGILAHKSRSDTLLHSQMLFMGKSYQGEKELRENLYLKMHGRKLYQYALENVPSAIMACLEKCNLHLNDIKKVLIHQANGKMDDAILKRLYSLYGQAEAPEGVMPMTIGWLGNSSVATLPTLLDLMLSKKMEGHRINPGDIVVFASVGAGMHINAAVYRF